MFLSFSYFSSSVTTLSNNIMILIVSSMHVIKYINILYA